MDVQRILVVEDEDLVRDLVVETLTDAGFEVDEARDSDEAVRLLDADGYKLLLTDVHMPGPLDGIELAERAHAKEEGLPVIFVTGRPDVMGRLRGSGLTGAVLSKPFALAEVVSAVRRLLAG